MKKIMLYILNPIKADKEGAAKMNTKIRKAIGIVGIIMAVYIIFKYIFVYVAPFLVAFLIVMIFKSGCHPSAKISVFSESRKRESFVLHDEPDPWNNRRVHVVPRCAAVCTDSQHFSAY